MWTRWMQRFAAVLLTGLTVSGLLSGCGGAGAGAGGPGGTDSGGSGTGVVQVADIVLFVDKPVLPGSDNATSAVVTAQVKDSANNAVANQRVSFSTTDNGVTLSPVGTTTVTDTAGKMQVKVELGAGAAARLNRVIPVQASVQGISRTTNITIAGTRLTLNGPDSLASGASADYSLAVLDGAGLGLSGVPVTVTFTGGTPASQQVTTATNGQATVKLTATGVGAALIEATANGVDKASRTVQLYGGSTPLRFIFPADNAQIDVNTSQIVRLQLKPNGVPLAGASVTVAATRGTLGPAPGSTLTTLTTDANGEAVVSISSPSVGTSTLSAAAVVGGVQLSSATRLSFVSRLAEKIALSPDVAALSANAAGSSSSATRLVATVRDASDNLVTGATVSFSAVDPSGGRIDPGLAVTDSNGQAIVSFVAGSTSTGPGGVVVKASVLNPSGVLISDSKSLTVSAAGLFVELGTGNTISAVDSTSYMMPWSAIVTDANRNPVAGAKVTATLTAVNYRKGVWVFRTSWQPASYYGTDLLSCASEDINGNNLLDVGEDLNGNRRLDPGSPATVQVTSEGGATGANGLAQLAVTYPKSFGEWTEVIMRVTIATSGTESTITRQFYLPVLGEDVNDIKKAPPNVGARGPGNELLGPYGYIETNTSVTDPATGRQQRFCTSPD